jgi:hypothetical protein
MNLKMKIFRKEIGIEEMLIPLEEKLLHWFDHVKRMYRVRQANFLF